MIFFSKIQKKSGDIGYLHNISKNEQNRPRNTGDTLRLDRQTHTHAHTHTHTRTKNIPRKIFFLRYNASLASLASLAPLENTQGVLTRSCFKTVKQLAHM